VAHSPSAAFTSRSASSKSRKSSSGFGGRSLLRQLTRQLPGHVVLHVRETDRIEPHLAERWLEVDAQHHLLARHLARLVLRRRELQELVGPRAELRHLLPFRRPHRLAAQHALHMRALRILRCLPRVHHRRPRQPLAPPIRQHHPLPVPPLPVPRISPHRHDQLLQPCPRRGLARIQFCHAVPIPITILSLLAVAILSARRKRRRHIRDRADFDPGTRSARRRSVIVADKERVALWSINAVLVVARALAYERASHELLADVLDTAEYLPLLLLHTSDETAHFRDMLAGLADRDQRFQIALDRFDAGDLPTLG
jgi:hypothetical protein